MRRFGKSILGKCANMAVRTSLAAGLLIACCGLVSAADDQLPWAEDFAQACRQANAQGKLVLLHFYSDDCPPCVRVERNVFSQAAVAEAVGRNYVPVKVHVRKTPALAAKYNVQQWPTDVFVTPEGLEVKRSVSPQSPEDYINLTNAVAATAGVGAGRQSNASAPRPTAPSPAAPWRAASPQSAIAQVSNQADAPAPWMAPGAAAAAQQTAQQTAHQVQQSAQQVQQNVQQAGQQAWQYGQVQANQTLTNTTQAAQQSTQAAAEAAKEVINRYSQPLSQPAAASPSWQPPFVTGAAAGVPGFAPALTPPEQPAQTLAPASSGSASAYETNPALAPPPAAIASGSYPIAMSGFCPVTLANERKWKKGQPQFGAIHRRRTFLFNSAAEQQTFLLEPDRYSPVMVGYDPVKFMQTGELIDGTATYSLTYRKQVYLFTDDASLKSFWQNPSQFTEGLRQAMTRNERSPTLR